MKRNLEEKKGKCWIESRQSVEMVLHKSILIIELILSKTKIGLGRQEIISWMEAQQTQSTLNSSCSKTSFLISSLRNFFYTILPRMCRHQTFPELIIAYLKFQGKIEKKIQNLDISLICSDVFAWRQMCHISMFHLAIIRTSS